MSIYEEPFDQITKKEIVQWAKNLDHKRKRLEFHIGLRTVEETGAPVLAAMEETRELLFAYANLWLEDILPEGNVDGLMEVHWLWAETLTELYAGTEYTFLLDKLVEIALKFYRAPSSLQTNQQQSEYLARALHKKGWFKKYQKIKGELGYYWYPPTDTVPGVQETQDYDLTYAWEGR